MGKGLAQETLAVGRVARPEAGGAAGLEVPGELEPDLLEHFEVAAGDRVACPLECVEWGVELIRQPSEPGSPLEEAAAQELAPERRDRMQEPAAFREPAFQSREQVLAADRPSCLA